MKGRARVGKKGTEIERWSCGVTNVKCLKWEGKCRRRIGGSRGKTTPLALKDQSESVSVYMCAFVTFYREPVIINLSRVTSLLTH